MLKAFLLAACSLLGTSYASAALIDRGDGLVYDDVLNITWLRDANYARTSGYDADGLMSWDQAMAWANQLVYGGFDDWRLPFVVDTNDVGCDLANSGTDCGFNVQTISGTTVFSEMAYMYYINLGLKAFRNPDGSIRFDWGIFGNGTWNGTDNSSYGQNDVGLIKNLQAFAYVTGTERGLDAANPVSIGVWNFGMNDGFQDTNYKYLDYYAWAVRDGDVATTAVPEPQTLALVALGLAMVGWTLSRRSA